MNTPNRCKEIDSLDLGGWNERVISLLENGFFSIPGRLKVVGFDRTTPMENRLFAAHSIYNSLPVLDQRRAFEPGCHY